VGHVGKQDGKKGSNLCAVRLSKSPTLTSEKALLHDDSWAVAMEAGICYECVTAHQPNGVALKMDEVKSA